MPMVRSVSYRPLDAQDETRKVLKIFRHSRHPLKVRQQHHAAKKADALLARIDALLAKVESRKGRRHLKEIQQKIKGPLRELYDLLRDAPQLLHQTGIADRHDSIGARVKGVEVDVIRLKLLINPPRRRKRA